MSKSVGLAAKLALLASLQGITQSELAERVGLLPGNLNRYLRGHCDIRSTLMIEIARELGIDFEELVNRELARRTGMKLERGASLGEVVESIAGSVSEDDRRAMVSFIAKIAQLNMGAKGKPHVRILRNWL